MSENAVTAVLVHGAWADGSSWNKVISSLSAHGVKSIAAPLPLTSLPDDVAALERALARIDGPVVLVGHAYAGAVIAGVRSEKVRSLVYVAALAPAEGETVADVFNRAAPHPMAPKLVPDDYGFIWLPDDAFAAAFAQLATPEEHVVLAAIQRPIALQCIGLKVERPLWLDRPSWFLVAEADRMIAPDTQRFMAARMKALIRQHPVDHAPSVTAPDLVTDIILEAIGESGRSRRGDR
ncbi:MAG TPA: alpha/beta hydrolase [Bryobacteraceae bacterium]|jgi:pimeloyl-ACP methyl ester carboxylesterase|nr:alpha/beta hydrolase [Bryobacteraceae bacterium]